MKIVLTSDESIRLEPTAGPLTIEAMSADQSYSPFHMLASSLAICTLSVMSAWATHAKLTADDLTIDVGWTFGDEPHRVASMALTFVWASLPSNRYSAAVRVAEMCTIHATLLQPPSITIAAAATGSVPGSSRSDTAS